MAQENIGDAETDAANAKAARRTDAVGWSLSGPTRFADITKKYELSHLCVLREETVPRISRDCSILVSCFRALSRWKRVAAPISGADHFRLAKDDANAQGRAIAVFIHGSTIVERGARMQHQ